MSGRPVLLVVLMLLAAGCSGGSSPSPPANSPSASVSPSAATVREVPLRDRQIKRFAMTGQPDWMAADDRYLYVREDSGEIVAVDPRTNRIAWRVSVPSEDLCQGLGLGFGSLWTCSTGAGSDGDDVVRIDTRTHRVVATLHVGKSSREGRIVSGFGRMWVISSTPDGSNLIGIDPESNKADPPIPLGVLAVELATDDQLLWAVSSFTGEIVAVDPQDGRVVHHIEGLGRLGGPSIISVSGDYVWVSGEDATVAIDRATGEVAAEIPMGARGYGGLVADGSDLWLHPGEPFLVRYDIETAQPVERIVASDLPNPGDVTIAFGSLWASSNNQSTLVRLRLD
jgi:DNA-binding beta-propeller fold protein YncE